MPQIVFAFNGSFNPILRPYSNLGIRLFECRVIIFGVTKIQNFVIICKLQHIGNVVTCHCLASVTSTKAHEWVGDFCRFE